MSNKRPDNWRPGRKASDPAREVAYRVLMAVELEAAYANLELPHEIRAARLNKRDAAYATNLCYGALRMRGRWDAIAAYCMPGKKIAELDPEVRALIRLGIQQLHGFQTPAHAAINETVALARNVVGTGASGFVNAVLHRASERELAEWREQILRDSGEDVDSEEFYSTWYSHPRWIVRALADSLQANGRPRAELRRVLTADNEPAHVALAAREISVSALQEDIARGHMKSAPGVLVDSAVLLQGGDPGRVFAVRDALAGVQDEGSQLVARTFAQTPLAGRDELWLDLCAGPGGKTATMAAYAAQKGARVHANELHAHRLDLVEDAIAPWADIVDLRLGDGREIGALEPGEYDRVLVDAPCTGIGAVRRRPELRWQKQAGDAIDLAALQGELLDSAWQAVRAGGLVAYVTCSPYVRETRTVTQAFLARHSDAQLLDTPQLASKEAKMPLSGTDKQLQLWPDLHQSDAMYMALLHKAD